MLIGYDPKKSAINSRERGLPFDLVVDLVWETAIIVEDLVKLLDKVGMKKSKTQ